MGPSNLPQNEDPALFAQCSLNSMDDYMVSVATTPASTGDKLYVDKIVLVLVLLLNYYSFD